jgi:hypothetical protein
MLNNNNNGNKNNTNEAKPHRAWAYQHRRQRKTVYTIPLEIGEGRINVEDNTAILYLDREPKGGYGGYIAEIHLLPEDVDPRVRMTPQRPGEGIESSDQSDANSDDE